MATRCSESVCCPPNDLAFRGQDGEHCPDGYTWDGTECVPIPPLGVECSVVEIETEELDDAVIGVAYSDTLQVTGGNEPYTWLLYSGELPDGLSLNVATGEISGTPTSDAIGISEFVVKVTDANGQICSRALSIITTSSVLLAYWKLDDSGWVDSAGTRVLTPDGAVSNSAGILSDAANFADTGASLARADDAGLQLQNTDITLRIWVKIVAFTGTSGILHLAGKFTTTGGFVLRFLFPGLYSVFSGIVHDQGGVTHLVEPPGPGSITLGIWYHLVLTAVRSTGSVRLYQNGALLVQSTLVPFTSVGTTNAEDFRLGGIDTGTPVSNFIVDEVGLWKYAWSAADVTNDYNAGAGRTFPDVPI